MPQQINLCSPILQTQKRSFSASTMGLSLGVGLLLGGALIAYWVWSLSSTGEEHQRTLSAYAKEKENLQTAIKTRQASAGPADSGLTKDLQSRRTQLEQRERLLTELRRGLLREGQGHAARLHLVAKTIPAPVWVTEVLIDENQMEVRGYTLEPAAINEWVARLVADPVLQGQVLSAVKVERVSPEVPNVPASAARQQQLQQPSWAFTLLSAVASPSVAAPGVRP